MAQSASSASPLQQKAGVLVRRLGVVAVIVAIALFGLSLARGEPWTRALLGAVSLAMAAIPEEFPIVLTLFLSAGAWRLASRGMLVRRLASVETLGSTTVICTDKTGTLTRGEFQMTRHLALAPAVSEQDVLEASVLACERHPTDAMGARLVRAQPPAASHRPIWTPAGRSSGTTTSIRSASTCRTCGALDDDGYMVAAKGALEGILAHSQSTSAAAQPSKRTAGSLRRACECSRSRSSAWTSSAPIGTRTSAI